MRKIAIGGPESRGKTTWCEALAAYYDAPMTTEIARGYLAEQDGKYDEQDLRIIAGVQHDVEIVEMERGWQAHQENFPHIGADCDPFESDETGKPLVYPEMPLFLCDTDMITIRIWSQEKFGHVHPEIENLVQRTEYDYWVLCRPDIPWEPDPLRENPHDRDRLFEVFEQNLRDLGRPFIVIEGSHEERMRKATAFIDVFIDGDPVKERSV